MYIFLNSFEDIALSDFVEALHILLLLNWLGDDKLEEILGIGDKFSEMDGFVAM